jgi:formylmethanofuran dehydrogenase subunit E
MESFDALLEKATAIHGHICAGQVIGVRMAMLGLQKIDIFDPLGLDRKKLYVLVEIDRCATDAIQTVTGCSLGKRSLKWLDHGVMAASFLNLVTEKAVRITALEESREHAKKYCPEIEDKYKQQLQAYKIMPENELFKLESIQLTIPENDMPGRPLSRVQCEGCQDWVQDGRDINQDGKTLCKSCAFGKYYKNT